MVSRRVGVKVYVSEDVRRLYYLLPEDERQRLSATFEREVVKAALRNRIIDLSQAYELNMAHA